MWKATIGCCARGAWIIIVVISIVIIVIITIIIITTISIITMVIPGEREAKLCSAQILCKFEMFPSHGAFLKATKQLQDCNMLSKQSQLRCYITMDPDFQFSLRPILKSKMLQSVQFQLIMI